MTTREELEKVREALSDNQYYTAFTLLDGIINSYGSGESVETAHRPVEGRQKPYPAPTPPKPQIDEIEKFVLEEGYTPPHAHDVADPHIVDLIIKWQSRAESARAPVSGVPDHNRVTIPSYENEAVLMVLLGTEWLQKNAPHRLTLPRMSEDDAVALIAQALCINDGRDLYSPTCDIYIEGDNDAIYPWASYRKKAKDIFAAMQRPA